MSDSTAMLNDALAAAATSTTQTLVTDPAVYTVSAPIVVPAQVRWTTSGNYSRGIPTGNYGNAGLPLQGIVLQPSSGFTGSCVIQLPTATTQSGGQTLESITVDGTNLPAGNSVNGIEALGYNAAVTLSRCTVSGKYNSNTTTGLGGNGLHLNNDGTSGHNPDFWYIENCKFSQCGQWGASAVGLADTFWLGTEFTANHSGGITHTNGGNSKFVGCRAASNGSVVGWNLIGASGFTGVVMFSCCAAELNGTGWAVSGSGTGTFNITQCSNTGSTGTAWTYSGSMHVHSPGAYTTSTTTPIFQ